jgi:hypothetical protein
VFQHCHTDGTIAWPCLTPDQAANCSTCEIFLQTSSVKAGREQLRAQFPENPLEPPLQCPAASIQCPALNRYDTCSIRPNPEKVKSAGGLNDLSVWHYGKSTHQVLGRLWMASGCVPVAEAALQFVLGFAVQAPCCAGDRFLAAFEMRASRWQ